jgi:hypothetical protein
MDGLAKIHSLTPTQQRIVDVLKDGQLHPMSELQRDLLTEECVRAHIWKLKQRLRLQGRDIERESSYRLVYKK